MKTTLALASAFATLPALAHDGHGLLGSHWHPTDVLGFVGVAALLGLAIWMSRK